MANLFKILNAVNVNDNTEEKNGLTYLSWPWAWAEVKKRYPEAHYTIWKDTNGKPYAFDPLTGFMVYTTVTIGEESHEMWLPVMDGANNAMKAEPYDYTVKNPAFKWAKWDKERGGYYDKYGNEQTEYTVKHVNAATMFDINKAIMRCLVKNLAMFGLGLYIYAGEDLPECERESSDAPSIPKTPGSAEAAQSAGAAKLQQMTEAAEPVKLIAPGQAQFIINNCPAKELEKYKAKYGDGLEKMPYGNASRFVKMLQERIREREQTA